MSFALESKYVDHRGNFSRKRSLLQTSDEVLAVLRDCLENDAFSDLVIVQHDGLPEPAKKVWTRIQHCQPCHCGDTSVTCSAESRDAQD